MKTLSNEECMEVGAGFFPLLIAAVAIFTMPYAVSQANKEYNQWGQSIGQASFEYMNPYDPNR